MPASYYYFNFEVTINQASCDKWIRSSQCFHFLLNNLLKGQFSSTRLPVGAEVNQDSKWFHVHNHDTNLSSTIPMIHNKEKKAILASISMSALVS